MKPKATKIHDPEAYFRDWDYHVAPCHYEALGVTLRTYIDKDKTKEARAKALANGISSQQASKINVEYLCRATQAPPCFDFHIGDIFYQQKSDISYFIQVAACAEPAAIEVHYGIVSQEGFRKGYVISSADLAAWLKTGITPGTNNGVTRESSQSGLMAWSLSPPS